MKKLIILSSIFAVMVFTSACATNDQGPDAGSMMESMDHNMMDDMSGMQVNSDEEFLAMMIPHHQEAIDSSEIILEKSENVELKALAQNIIDAQTSEIAQMEKWGEEWFGEEFEASDDYEEMMPALAELDAEELDQAFITGMIHHHEGAIMMARMLKSFTERQELLDMADDIIEAQTKEVEMMKSWLK